MKSETVVVMAYYKGQKYFKEQIDSIRAQTKVPDKLIIVNDSPKDKKASKFLHSFNYGKLNVTIKDNKTNLGCTKTFYEGIKMAYKIDAKYIFISDQDDIWLPNKIQRQYDALINGADICNHYSQKFIDNKPSSVLFANCAGHSLAFKASSFKKGISLLSNPYYNNGQLATYDSILSFIPFIYDLKWTTIEEVLVYHRLYNKEHFTINSEMHRSIIQDLKNIHGGFLAYYNMRDFLDQNADYPATPAELFKYYRLKVNKYNLCDNVTKIKNSIFTVLGRIKFY